MFFMCFYKTFVSTVLFLKPTLIHVYHESLLHLYLCITFLYAISYFCFQVLFLNLFTNVDAICMPVLKSLQPVTLELKKFSNKYPELFFKVRVIQSVVRFLKTIVLKKIYYTHYDHKFHMICTV